MKVHLLSEALTPSEKAQVDTWERPHHAFSDHAFGGTQETRTTIPLIQPKSPHEIEIAAHLEKHGFKLTDYRNGIVEGKFGRQQKLGKVLQRTGATHLLEKFSSDPSRASKDATAEKYHVVISRHPHDVAGMTSEGHSWCDQSCMNFKTGVNRKYLPQEVKAGTHVAYLTHKDDHDIKEPIARIAIKPYNSITGPAHTILRPENRAYGNAPDSFSHTVSTWAHQHFPAHDEHIYEKSKHSYNDTGNDIEYGHSALESALLSANERVRYSVVGHPNLPSEAIHKYFHAAAEDALPDTRGRGMLSSHITLAQELANHARLRPDTAKLIMDRASDTSKPRLDVISAADRWLKTAGYRLSADVNDTILAHPSSKNIDVSRFAIRDNLSHAAIDHLLDHGVSEDKLANNPSLSHKHIDKILTDVDMRVHKDRNTVQSLAGNPALAPHHFDKIMDYAKSGEHEDGAHMQTVYEQLLRNPNLRQPHMDRLAEEGGERGLDALSWMSPTVSGVKLKQHHLDALVKQASNVHQNVRFAQNYKLSPSSLDHLVNQIDHEAKSGSKWAAFDSGRRVLRSRIPQDLTSDHIHKLIDHISNEDYGGGDSSDSGITHVKAIVNHPNTKPEHITHLQKTDVDPYIVTQAAAHKFDDSHFETALQNYQARQVLARGKNTPQKHLKTLVDHFSGHEPIAYNLIDNPSVGVEHLPKIVGNATPSYGVLAAAKNRGLNPDTPEEIRHKIGRAMLSNPRSEEADGPLMANIASSLIPASKATHDDLTKIIGLGRAGSKAHHHRIFSEYMQFANYKPEHVKHLVDNTDHRSPYDTSHPDFYENVLREAKIKFPEHDFHDIKKHVEAAGADHWKSALKEVNDNP